MALINRCSEFNILSWPPRSSTACTKCACSAVVHRIRGALELLLAPPPPPGEFFLNPWAVWLGWWCSRSRCTWRLCSFTAAASSTFFEAAAMVSSSSSSSPSISLGSGGILTPPAGGDGGLMWRERSGGVVVVGTPALPVVLMVAS